MLLWWNLVDSRNISIYIYNYLTLSKGNDPQLCGWASSNQLKGKTEVSLRKKKFCLRLQYHFVRWPACPTVSDMLVTTTWADSLIYLLSPSLPLSCIYYLNVAFLSLRNLTWHTWTQKYFQWVVFPALMFFRKSYLEANQLTDFSKCCTHQALNHLWNTWGSAPLLHWTKRSATVPQVRICVLNQLRSLDP